MIALTTVTRPACKSLSAPVTSKVVSLGATAPLHRENPFVSLPARSAPVAKQVASEPRLKLPERRIASERALGRLLKRMAPRMTLDPGDARRLEREAHEEKNQG